MIFTSIAALMMFGLTACSGSAARDHVSTGNNNRRDNAGSWNDKNSRSTKEQNNKKSRPEIASGTVRLIRAAGAKRRLNKTDPLHFILLLLLAGLAVYNYF